MGRAQFLICCIWLVLCLKYAQMLPCIGGSNHLDHGPEPLLNYVGSGQGHDLTLRIQIDHQSSYSVSSLKDCGDDNPVNNDNPVKPNSDTPKNFGYPLDFLWIFDFQPNIELPQPMYLEPPESESNQTEEITVSTETETTETTISEETTESPETIETTETTTTSPEDKETSESPQTAETTRIIQERPPYLGGPPFEGISNSHIRPNYLGCTLYCP